MLRKLSSKSKRATRSRKQPAIPINSNLALHQQKLLAKLNLKQQHSLTSSDENLHDDFDSLRDTENNNNDATNENSNEIEQEEQQTDYLEDEDEEEVEEEEEEEEENEEEEEDEEEEEVEDHNNFNDMDEEICSTTEYTTNDEMDLESGSISASANVTRAMHMKNSAGGGNNNCYTLNDIKKKMELSDNTNKTSIDDYLMQTLEKDEILAAKMSKFLSVIFQIFALISIQ